MAPSPDIPSMAVLSTFVSSNKADVFKCHSIDEQTFIAPPYACSYSHGAKRGLTPHLAVATEQGTIHILNTSKREDWDAEPQRTSFQPHANGVFDVRWSLSDSLLATASGDQSVRITTLASSVATADRTLHVLHGHQGTVKCVAWDPSHDGDILCTGGRDGSICLWDLRAGERRLDNGSLAPVLTVSKAHDDLAKIPKSKSRGRKLVPNAPLKSITHLLYTDVHPHGIVSSSSFDGIVHLWDVRLPTASPTKSSRSTKPPRPAPVLTSADPTTAADTRRPRGLTTLALGSGPTAGLLYALSNDARVHTYALPTLAPLSGAAPGADPYAFADPRMQTNSFYVRLAASPCGRWLASGSVVDGVAGRAYLFDAAAAASARRAWEVGRSSSSSLGAGCTNTGVELRGQMGEVGALDWADGILATCADDGTVRVWRPDVEIARRCAEESEEMKWEWSCASA
ncbi:WD40 repeat-like protein [Epithele typhae]|uniref:WD40 repeat-like protein n=1 Tax=Epithele typhae TaxID=378194 RepID=UPI002008B4F6|nr:WD40 repeat-like protein [Epithele typhae]KAH9943128.1 WD40 repeat-like protein [Epithele typhae]